MRLEAPQLKVSAPIASSVLLRELLWLAVPVLVENVLHMVVGLTDVFLAGHLPQRAADATAAVGSITYILWLIGLISGAIGAGSTAIIARAVGAKHRSLANSVCGQSVSASLLVGGSITAIVFVFALPIAGIMGLEGGAHEYALYYLRVLCFSLPFSILMFTANACLRGAGDSVSPAVAMVVVDLINVLFSFALTRGWFGFPAMGFRGIALGTVIAYAAGGFLQFAVLLSGRAGLRLFLHRMRPHWLTLKRVLRIGLPSGFEGLLSWLASFVVVIIINRADATNVMAAAHIVTVRIESLSFMAGLAVATAAATMVGTSLGMRQPDRARRSAWLAYGLGAGFMSLCAIGFICFGKQLASVLSNDARIIRLASTCLFITAFSQPGFAASMIFGGALRGAGDTFKVMLINLASVLLLRLTGALAVGCFLPGSLYAIWCVLAAELTCRGFFIFLRFHHGGWRDVRV